MYKLMMMVITILSANLASGFISREVLSYNRTNFSPKIATFIGMCLILLVLYPLFRYLNGWTTSLSKSLVKAGKKFLGRKIGAFIVFFILLTALYFGYMKLWFSV